MALTDSLAAYWKFDEASGNAADSSGNSYTLTNNNTVGYAAGIINNGGDFGSSNTNKTFTRTADTLGIVVDAARSFAGWFQISVDPTSGTVYDVMGQGYNPSDVFYIFEYGNFGGTKRFRVGRARSGVDDPTMTYDTTLTTSTWYHIAYTIDGSRNQIFYFNGTSVDSDTAASGNGSGTTTTGTLFSTAFFATARLLQGKVDEWGVWSRVLTSDEVTELYNGGAGLTYPFTAASAIKTFNGVARANVKTVNAAAIATVKTYNGIA